MLWGPFEKSFLRVCTFFSSPFCYLVTGCSGRRHSNPFVTMKLIATKLVELEGRSLDPSDPFCSQYSWETPKHWLSFVEVTQQVYFQNKLPIIGCFREQLFTAPPGSLLCWNLKFTMSSYAYGPVLCAWIPAASFELCTKEPQSNVLTRGIGTVSAI